MYLCDLKKGEIATVTDITLSGNIRRRLQDLGLIVGTKVECVLISYSGNPKAYRIRGALIAIRNEDAVKIQIRKEFRNEFIR